MRRVGKGALLRAVPTIQPRTAHHGGHGASAPLPTLRTARGIGVTRWPTAHRHCERSEAIQTFGAARTGLLRGACHRAGVRPTRWLAMTGQESAISRRHAPEVCKNSFNSFAPSIKRAQGMPGARCTRSFACKKEKTHAHLQGSPESHRHSLRNGVNGSSVVALVYRAC